VLAAFGFVPFVYFPHPLGKAPWIAHLMRKRNRTWTIYMAERAKVPGGWLVITQFKIGSAHGLVFLPDPDHKWDGGSPG
jgi:hypothetical protein